MSMVILGEMFDDTDVVEILGAALAGVATGNLIADRVAEIEPNSTISFYE